MHRSNIILTGFMGTGKTTVGKILAQKCGYSFIDTDLEIESSQGKTVAEIFATQGEGYFRKLESQVAETLAKKKRQVIATGGKLMLNPENAEILSKTGHIFCLTATVEEIVRRVTGEGTRLRPLLAGENPEEKVRQILKERKEGYGRFHQVNTDGRTPQEIADDILVLLQSTDS